MPKPVNLPEIKRPAQTPTSPLNMEQIREELLDKIELCYRRQLGTEYYDNAADDARWLATNEQLEQYLYQLENPDEYYQ